MIKVLHVVSALDNGGVERMLKDYYENIDKTKLLFDFIVHDPEIGELESFFENNECRVFRVTPKKNGLFKNFLQIKNIINKNDYDIIHCHQNLSSFVPLYLGLLKRVEVRIAHSHVFKDKQKLMEKILEFPQKILTKTFATDYFSSSIEAGEWLFGKKSNNFYVMNNAINLSDFKFSGIERAHIRTKYSLEDKVVLGHVGRFVQEKNHFFLLELLKEIKLVNNNYKLLLIGNGEMEAEIKNEILEGGLTEDVVIVSQTNEVSKFYNAMDLFLFPSQYEGFGRVLVEAQITGLKCIANSTISKETKISNNVEYICINNGKEDWYKEIIDAKYEVKRDKVKLRAERYEIKNAAIDLENKYLSFFK